MDFILPGGSFESNQMTKWLLILSESFLGSEDKSALPQGTTRTLPADLELVDLTIESPWSYPLSHNSSSIYVVIERIFMNTDKQTWDFILPFPYPDADADADKKNIGAMW